MRIGRELYEYLKPVLNRRFDVLLKDTNPKYDEYVEELINQLKVAGSFTPDEWQAKLDELASNHKVKIKELI